MFDKEWTAPLPIYAWLLEHPEGLIVVDTGETARTKMPGYFPWWHPYYRFGVRLRVRPEEEIGPQLLSLGVRPEDVASVVMTHLHTDHSGGLHGFRHSKIYVSPEEYALARGTVGTLLGYLPQRWPEWFQPEPIMFESVPLGPFSRTARLTAVGYVTIVPTPGHTVGHVSVVALSEGITYFLAGDTSYTLRLMEEQEVDGISPDEEEALRTLRKIRQYCSENPTVYLPTHDPHSAQRLAGKVTV